MPRQLNRIFTILFSIGCTTPCFAKETVETFRFHDVTITLIKQVDEKKNQPEEPQGPSYTIHTRKNKKAIDEIAFKKVEAVGGSSDIMPLKKQPLLDYFILTKAGDYDHRLLLISKNGKIFSVPDGHVFKSEKYLHFYREDTGPEPGESLRLNLKDQQIEADQKRFPENLKSMKALDRKTFKWIPAEQLSVIDEESGKTMSLKEYIGRLSK